MCAQRARERNTATDTDTATATSRAKDTTTDTHTHISVDTLAFALCLVCLLVMKAFETVFKYRTKSKEETSWKLTQRVKREQRQEL